MPGLLNEQELKTEAERARAREEAVPKWHTMEEVRGPA